MLKRSAALSLFNSGYVQIMNIRKIYGALLAMIGTAGLVYATVSLVNPTGLSNIMVLVIYCILGLAFFIAGINLVRTIKDEQR